MRVAAGEPSPGAWLDALADPAWGVSARVLKEEGGDLVVRSRLRVAGQDREVVIKRRRTRGVVETLKSLAGGGRLMRQWRGAAWLTARGIPTARPLALARRVSVPVSEEVLVMELLAGRSLLEHLAQRTLTPGEGAALAAEVGVMAARLVAAGRYNRDHKPSNLIVTRAEGGPAEVAVIDAVAIRSTAATLRGLDRMLASLVLEPMGCGCPPTPWEMRRVVKAAAAELASREPALRRKQTAAAGALAWTLWTAAAEIVEAHGDPTPKVDPLHAPGAWRPGAGGIR